MRFFLLLRTCLELLTWQWPARGKGTRAVVAPDLGEHAQQQGTRLLFVHKTGVERQNRAAAE